uniref:Uncharacterized protein n=1 Tax=Arundo donax TaxID=35708 RepID=A0A0A9G4B5_ARUDO
MPLRRFPAPRGSPLRPSSRSAHARESPPSRERSCRCTSSMVEGSGGRTDPRQ